MNNITKLEEQHEKLTAQIEASVAEAEKLGAQIAGMKDDEAWPKSGSRYWYISAHGDVHSFPWDSDSFDNRCATIGNAYRTEAEAQKEVDRRKVLTKLRGMTNGFVPDWSDGTPKYYLFHDHKFYGPVKWGIVSKTQAQAPGLMYFAARADAQAAIDELGDELMVLL